MFLINHTPADVLEMNDDRATACIKLTKPIQDPISVCIPSVGSEKIYNKIHFLWTIKCPFNGKCLFSYHRFK